MAAGSLFQLLILAVSSWSGAFGGVTTNTPNVVVREGGTAEMNCYFTSDFTSPRIEWKFIKDGSESFVYLDGKLTDAYKDRVDFYNTGIRLKSVSRQDNGTFYCEVAKVASPPLSGSVLITLLVQVPPSVPTIRVPTSVTTGSKAELVCTETDGIPSSTFTWYKDKVLIPDNPKNSPTFQNSSYTLNANTGVLTFNPVSKEDAGEYSCMAGNGVGADQSSSALRMDVNDVNVGGIVAAVVVVALILALIGVGVWLLYRRGYFGRSASASGKKVIYSQPSETRSDRNFQQTSSFLV
ncbi:junctional adhesion molecule A-like [Rhinatrema bivittatum]|uniref:junctional adhesion molecule A-like n=1 Tax=Rhinatrema bivittatum TaxID=194408 RepID=UPI00112C0D74|nr:junctional adhesion molecule A-like [Rhinatrema bivittatum]